MFFWMLRWVARLSNLALFGFALNAISVESKPNDPMLWLFFSILFVGSLSAIIYTFFVPLHTEGKGLFGRYYERKKLESELKTLKIQQEIKELKDQEE